ncbi:hypothetical protein EYF80_034677 [Liparis tanakae]|uniref:Uncharacterized protein n=1 Tax=Liparis tanakae TaxID=230148 RepID=A0A4Z2GQP6_9TELE|nr:hypothetical protein EYF80_034677 [Liparis tanakae]
MLGERPAHLWPVCIKPTTRRVSPNGIVTVLVRGPRLNTALFQSADYTSRKTRVGSNHAFTYQEGNYEELERKALISHLICPQHKTRGPNALVLSVLGRGEPGLAVRLWNTT